MVSSLSPPRCCTHKSCSHPSHTCGQQHHPTHRASVHAHPTRTGVGQDEVALVAGRQARPLLLGRRDGRLPPGSGGGGLSGLEGLQILRQRCEPERRIKILLIMSRRCSHNYPHLVRQQVHKDAFRGLQGEKGVR